MRPFVVVLGVVALAGCASSRGFDHGGLRPQVADEKVYTEEDIRKAFALKPQLPAPFRLAVYFSRAGERVWRWRAEDKDKLVALGAELKGRKIISDLVILPDDVVEGGDRRAIRIAAARAGADAVLIVNGAGDVDTTHNPLALSYALIVTYWIVPGTQAEGLFVANASMWDVRNQYLYLAAEAEGAAKQMRPGYFIEDAGVLKEAKADALSALVKQLGAQLGDMAAR